MIRCEIWPFQMTRTPGKMGSHRGFNMWVISVVVETYLKIIHKADVVQIFRQLYTGIQILIHYRYLTIINYIIKFFY